MKRNLEDLYKVSFYTLHLLNVHQCYAAEVIKWMEENLSGWWTFEQFEEPTPEQKEISVSSGMTWRVISLPGRHYYFENADDAMFFKLRWA